MVRIIAKKQNRNEENPYIQNNEYQNKTKTELSKIIVKILSQLKVSLLQY